MTNFNSSLRGSKAYMKAFQDAKPMQFNHYVRWMDFNMNFNDTRQNQ